MIDIYATCLHYGGWNVYKLVRSVDGVLAWEFQTYHQSLEFVNSMFHPFIVNHHIISRKEICDTLFDKPGGTRREYKEGDLVCEQSRK